MFWGFNYSKTAEGALLILVPTFLSHPLMYSKFFFSPFCFFVVVVYLEQEVAHLSQTGFGAFLEAVQVVSGQDTKSFWK
jgi:hypothetical protein